MGEEKEKKSGFAGRLVENVLGKGRKSPEEKKSESGGESRGTRTRRASLRAGRKRCTKRFKGKICDSKGREIR